VEGTIQRCLILNPAGATGRAPTHFLRGITMTRRDFMVGNPPILRSNERRVDATICPVSIVKSMDCCSAVLAGDELNPRRWVFRHPSIGRRA
jgi:hypothetical protein